MCLITLQYIQLKCKNYSEIYLQTPLKAYTKNMLVLKYICQSMLRAHFEKAFLQSISMDTGKHVLHSDVISHFFFFFPLCSFHFSFLAKFPLKYYES